MSRFHATPPQDHSPSPSPERRQITSTTAQMHSVDTGKEPTEILPKAEMSGRVDNSVITYQQIELTANICMSEHKKPKKAHVIQIMPQDYICSEEDIQILGYVRQLPERQTVVDISNAFLYRYDMNCLFHDNSYVNGDVINAYIHCIREEKHLINRDGGKVFLENTIISSILKSDGASNLGHKNYKDDTVVTRVANYLDNDMLFIPINIEETHWYLAVVNAHKCEIHVLDSLGIMDRRDLHNTLRGLERHIKFAAQHINLSQEKWQKLDFTTWPIIEKFPEKMQTDGSSCGLWMINYMEYWTGSILSDRVTQEDITNFRFKLASILWCSNYNTKKVYMEPEPNNEDHESPSEVQIVETPNDVLKPCEVSHRIESDTSMCILAPRTTLTNRKELVGALCKYIMSIDCAESLEKEWIRSMKPYPISLSLRNLQDILDVNKSMDKGCFNMAVRMLTCNPLLLFLDDTIHYMDLQFWSISDFHRDPRRRAKLDVKRLAKLFECWPGMEYNISNCSKILLRHSFLGHFTLFVLDMKARTVFILDPLHIPDSFKGPHPTLHYVHKINNIAINVKLAMEEANPTWNDDIYLWNRKIPRDVPKMKNWEVTGFCVLNFMCSWDGAKLASICTDENKLRTGVLIDILKCNENKAEDNIPIDIQDFVARIRD